MSKVLQLSTIWMNTMVEKYSRKLIGSKEERAVSPVIGVILMVAITVILAAVIAAFVLDIGPGEPEPNAAVDVIDDGDGDFTVELRSLDNADAVVVVTEDSDDDVLVSFKDEEGDGDAAISVSGQSEEFDEGETVQAIRTDEDVSDLEGEEELDDIATANAIVDNLDFD